MLEINVFVFVGLIAPGLILSNQAASECMLLFVNKKILVMHHVTFVRFVTSIYLSESGYFFISTDSIMLLFLSKEKNHFKSYILQL